MTEKEIKTSVDIEEVGEIVGKNKHSEKFRKKVSIIKGARQLTIRLPKNFVEQANINPKEHEFEFVLVPLVEGNKKFTLEAHLKKKQK